MNVTVQQEVISHHREPKTALMDTHLSFLNSTPTGIFRNHISPLPNNLSHKSCQQPPHPLLGGRSPPDNSDPLPWFRSCSAPSTPSLPINMASSCRLATGALVPRQGSLFPCPGHSDLSLCMAGSRFSQSSSESQLCLLIKGLGQFPLSAWSPHRPAASTNSTHLPRNGK